MCDFYLAEELYKFSVLTLIIKLINGFIYQKKVCSWFHVYKYIHEETNPKTYI